MKRSIAAASLALIAAIAASAPAQAQWASNKYDAQFTKYDGAFNKFDAYKYDSLLAKHDAYNNKFGAHFNSQFNLGSDIDSMQAQLEARIASGVASKRLTPREASQLRAKLSHIATVEARLRSTGNRLSFSERNRLKNKLTTLSAEITREMNDFDRRFAGRHRGWR